MQWIWAFLALSLFAGLGNSHGVAQSSRPDWLRPCEIQNYPGPALCGTYEVWENRTTRTGRTIAMNVVVVPARSGRPLPDPLFFFTGGPGQAATDGAGGMMPLFEAIAEDRDVIFIDQRGTGASSPLDCPQPDTGDDLQSYFTDFYPDDFVRRCLAHQSAEVGLYTTPIAVDDIDEIRAALGYERVNLWGGSYGTRAAQVFMKRHPEAVRTAVFHGVAPMDMENPLPFAKALDMGVQGLIEACMAEPACGEAYPALADDWERSKRYFDGGRRVTATVEHPTSGTRGQVEIGKGTYGDGVRHVLYSVAASRQLPGMIHAAGGGDFDAFAQSELLQTIGFNEMLSSGMFLTVTCAEDLRFVSEDDIRRETEGTFLGDYRVRRQLAACGIWGRGEGVDESYQEPVRVDVPVLIVSGEFDTATPPDGGERVAGAFPHALHLVFPNQAHRFANFPCEARITTEFIQRGDFEGVDVSCAGETRRPPFDTSVGRGLGGSGR